MVNSKSLGRKIALFILLALTMTACGKNPEQSEEPSKESTVVKSEEKSEEVETQEQVEEAQAMSESVMDVMCGASGIVARADGSLLVTDIYNKVIWQVHVHNGISTVYAGGETVADLYGEPVGGYNDDILEESYFKEPWAISPFLDGYAVSDAKNNVVRYVSKENVQTVNGSTKEKIAISNLGVRFENPTGLATDEDGNLYISDTLCGAIRKIDEKGNLVTVADELEEPMGLCWKNGVLYIAEAGLNRIVKLEAGKVTVVAGGEEAGFEDGEGTAALFDGPQGVAVSDDGVIYVADTGNSAVREIRDGVVSTLLSRDRTSSLEMCPISPVGMLVSGNDLYICDSFARKVIRIGR